jgi:hypothetical protein
MGNGGSAEVLEWEYGEGLATKRHKRHKGEVLEF